MNERKVLGRGLSSLIPTAPLPKSTSDLRPATSATTTNATGALEVSLVDIRINPQQPRRHFSETAIEELSASIRQSGILQPLVVRKTDRGFELIAGERRLRAAKKAGLVRVPVFVRNSTDLDQLEMALVENLQREDLNPIEEALGYQRLMREYHLTQEQVAEKVGKERSTVSNLLRLLKLAPVVQEMISSGALSMGHARALVVVESERRQEELAQKIEREGLSVRQVEAMVKAMTTPGGSKVRRTTDSATSNPNLRHLSDELQRKLGTRVDIVSKGKKGEIRILYFSSEELSRLTERLLGRG